MMSADERLKMILQDIGLPSRRPTEITSHRRGDMKPRHALYVVLLLALSLMVACSKPVTPEATAPAGADTPVATAGSEEKTPEPPVGEVPMGYTSEGSAYRGDPDAPVTIYEFSDFL